MFGSTTLDFQFLEIVVAAGVDDTSVLHLLVISTGQLVEGLLMAQLRVQGRHRPSQAIVRLNDSSKKTQAAGPHL